MSHTPAALEGKMNDINRFERRGSSKVDQAIVKIGEKAFERLEIVLEKRKGISRETLVNELLANCPQELLEKDWSSVEEGDCSPTADSP